MVRRLNSGKAADSDTTGRGIARQRGRIGMNRRVTRRTVTITIVSTLFLGLLSIAAVAQVLSFALPARQAQVTQQDPDAAAGMVGVAPVGAASSSTPYDVLCDATGRGPCEFHPSEVPAGTLPIVHPDPGVGPLEYMPGEKDAGPPVTRPRP